MRITKTLAILAIASAVLLGGCATIMKGDKHNLKIMSTPTAAKVEIKTTSGVKLFEGTTPTQFKLSKSKEYLVTLSLENYKETTIPMSKDGIEGWFWGNIICGGLIGIVIDASNGAMNKLQPEEISVSMEMASLENGSQELYAVLITRDSNGELRHLAVPMIKG